MSHRWLVKSEPLTYSWLDFVKEGKTAWTNVRNFQARNNLRAMKKGDFVLFYQSVIAPSVVGIASVVQEAYPDPTATKGNWICVDLIPLQSLPSPVPLATIKANPSLSAVALIKQPRLSVMPVTEQEYVQILKMGSLGSFNTIP